MVLLALSGRMQDYVLYTGIPPAAAVGSPRGLGNT